MMEQRRLGAAEKQVSALALGGHEYHPDGRLRGFADDLQAATRPGYRDERFGGPQRRELVEHALAAGITYFDVTIDPEVHALGAILAEQGAQPDVVVQMRPQGMCYGYEEGNPGLADRDRLFREVERLLALSGRPAIDVLNFGFEAPALRDRSYLDRVGGNIAELKRQGLIRWAACDSLVSGEEHYLTVMEAGCFDVLWVTFGLLDPLPAERLFPAAQRLGLGIAVREAFGKGLLFQIAQAAGIPAGLVAGAAQRWVLAHDAVSTMVVGARDATQMTANITAVSSALSEADKEIVSRLQAEPEFTSALRERSAGFRAVPAN